MERKHSIDKHGEDSPERSVIVAAWRKWRI